MGGIREGYSLISNNSMDSGKHVGSFSFECLRGDISSPGAITEGGLGETGLGAQLRGADLQVAWGLVEALKTNKSQGFFRILLALFT